ncbi:MAG: DUF5906 domain-containing protein [Thermodesulfobacteriota bacterium]
MSGRWETLLNQMLPAPEHQEELRRFFRACLWPEHNRSYPYGLVLCGPGLGKSTTALLLERLTGRERTSYLSFSDIQRPFKRLDLMGKLLNFCGEPEPRGMKPEVLAFLKAAIAGERISAEKKYSPLYSFPVTAKFLFVWNTDFTANEKYVGLANRLRVLPVTFRPSKPDPRLNDKLWMEKEEVLAWSLGHSEAAI